MIADRERRKTVGEDGKAPKHDNMTPKYHGHDGDWWLWQVCRNTDTHPTTIKHLSWLTSATVGCPNMGVITFQGPAAGTKTTTQD